MTELCPIGLEEGIEVSSASIKEVIVEMEWICAMGGKPSWSGSPEARIIMPLTLVICMQLSPAGILSDELHPLDFEICMDSGSHHTKSLSALSEQDLRWSRFASGRIRMR